MTQTQKVSWAELHNNGIVCTLQDMPTELLHGDERSGGSTSASVERIHDGKMFLLGISDRSGRRPSYTPFHFDPHDTVEIYPTHIAVRLDEEKVAKIWRHPLFPFTDGFVGCTLHFDDAQEGEEDAPRIVDVRVGSARIGVKLDRTVPQLPGGSRFAFIDLSHKFSLDASDIRCLSTLGVEISIALN